MEKKYFDALGTQLDDDAFETVSGGADQPAECFIHYPLAITCPQCGAMNKLESTIAMQGNTPTGEIACKSFNCKKCGGNMTNEIRNETDKAYRNMPKY